MPSASALSLALALSARRQSLPSSLFLRSRPPVNPLPQGVAEAEPESLEQPGAIPGVVLAPWPGHADRPGWMVGHSLQKARADGQGEQPEFHGQSIRPEKSKAMNTLPKGVTS